MSMVTAKEMVETFQCPGCAHGENTRCGKFKLHEIPNDVSVEDGRDLVGGFRCRNHVTTADHGGMVNLGLPVPFARVQYRKGREGVQTNIRLYLYVVNWGTQWDVYNVPVWAMEKNGFLFVRTYSPRIDQSYVDVIHGGNVHTLQAVFPTAIDIGSMSDRMSL